MAEKTPNQQLAEKLLFKPAYVGDKSAAVKQEAHAFAEGYKKFLDAGKTEREVAAESEQMLKEAGYQQFDPKKTYAPGDKVYFSQLGKAIVASTIGTRSFEGKRELKNLPIWANLDFGHSTPLLTIPVGGTGKIADNGLLIQI